MPVPIFTNKTRRPQKDLRKPKKPSNENILSYINPNNSIFNPNNPNIYSTTKCLVNCLKNINVSDFHYINLIQCKRQPYNHKKLLTKAKNKFKAKLLNKVSAKIQNKKKLK